MINHNLNFHCRRFEFKYSLPRDIVDRVLLDILNYMSWDEYIENEDYYEVHNIYFETPSLKCYHEKLDGLRNRKKIRLRTYGHEKTTMKNSFLEIKRKVGEIIIKDRIKLSPDELKEIFINPFSLKESDKNKDIVDEFLFDLFHFGFKPTIITSYKRKAFFSKFGQHLRITIDFDLKVGKVNEGLFDSMNLKSTEEETSVLEVKFNGTLPAWFHTIINVHRLQKDSFSKFCKAIETCNLTPAYF